MKVLENEYCVISNDDRYLYIDNNGYLELDVMIDTNYVFDNADDARALRDKATQDSDLSYYKFYVVKLSKTVIE